MTQKAAIIVDIYKNLEFSETPLVEETGFDAVETSKAKTDEIQKYDVVILGGGIYASGIAGIAFLQKNIKALQDKKIIVFCVGASPFDDKALEEIKKRNMKGDLENIPCFYCRGGWDMDAMRFMDRNSCKILRSAVAKKKPEDYEIWEKALMAAGDEKCDWTDKENLKPMLEAVSSWLPVHSDNEK